MRSPASAQIEQELKYALSEQSHRKLVAALRRRGKLAGQENQANSYFDDKRWSLRRSFIGLRVRVIDEKRAQVALKYSARAPSTSAPPSFRSRHEIEDRIPLKTARAILQGKETIGSLNTPALGVVRKLAPKLRLEGLRCLGTLATHRTKIHYRGFCFEIDECRLFGRRFYEVEIETQQPDRADACVRELFAQIGIRCRHGEKSKAARFFEALARRRS